MTVAQDRTGTKVINYIVQFRVLEKYTIWERNRKYCTNNREFIIFLKKYLMTLGAILRHMMEKIWRNLFQWIFVDGVQLVQWKSCISVSDKWLSLHPINKYSFQWIFNVRGFLLSVWSLKYFPYWSSFLLSPAIIPIP